MLRLTQDYLLVRPIERRQSAVLEVVSNEKYTRGLVVAVGPGKERRDSRGNWTGRRKQMDVRPGDWITYGDPERGYDFWPKYTEDGVEYRVLQQGDVAFISEREFIDEHNALTDAEIDALICRHNSPLEIERLAVMPKQAYAA